MANLVSEYLVGSENNKGKENEVKKRNKRK
jgi:hypothetical protein